MERKIIAQHIHQITHCPQKDSMQLAELFLPHQLKKREQLQIQRDYSRSIFYLHTGLLLISQPKPNQPIPQKTDKETTLAIYQPSDIFFLPPSTHKPCPLSVKAIGHTQLFIADYHRVEQLIHRKHQLIHTYTSLGEHYLNHTLQHLQLLQLPNANQKLEHMQQHFGKHLYLIPYQYQASYLGISRKHLSRIT